MIRYCTQENIRVCVRRYTLQITEEARTYRHKDDL